jgi:hypothetical protein
MGELWGQYMSLIFPIKTPVGKIENMTHAYVNITSLKTLTRNLVSKTCERKEYNMMLVQINTFRLCLPLILANLRSCCIPILCTNFWNIEVDKDLVNKSARLSHDLICKMFISPLSCNSWLWTRALGDWQSTCLNCDLFLSCALYVHLCVFLVSFVFHL